jgi:hypothetical protein
MSATRLAKKMSRRLFSTSSMTLGKLILSVPTQVLLAEALQNVTGWKSGKEFLM